MASLGLDLTKNLSLFAVRRRRCPAAAARPLSSS